MKPSPFVLRRGVLSPALLVLCSAPAAAQIVNPAEAQKQPQSQESPIPEGSEAWQPTRFWGMPDETLVIARSTSRYNEEALVGPYQQPIWTTQRLFTTTRVYVVPEGMIQFEFWTRIKTPRDGPSTTETQYEFEVGLPNRFQLDLYYVTEKTGGEGDIDVSEQKYELRYAFADWGRLPANPTAYVEWVERSAQPDKFELKLLLGDQLVPGWHWGTNLVYEHEVSGSLESEYGITAGLSHAVSDGKLALGAEVKAALIDDKDTRGDYTQELEIGPSMRWQPLPAMHIDFAPLIGVGPDSRASDIFLVLGWVF